MGIISPQERRIKRMIIDKNKENSIIKSGLDFHNWEIINTEEG